MAHLTSTCNNSFSITFPNDFSLSVQFGPGDHCEHYNDSSQDISAYWRSSDAEIAVISPANHMLPFKNKNPVLGHVSVETLVKVIAYVAALTEQPDVIPFPEENND